MNGDLTMLGDTLRQLHEDGHLTAKQMADLLNLHVTSIYRFFNDTDPGFDRVRSIFRGSRSPAVQHALLQLLIAGTGWVATLSDASDAELDANGDGAIDEADAVASAITLVYDSAASLKHVSSVTHHKPSAAELQEMLAQVIGEAIRCQRVLAHIEQVEHRRRKCRPLSTAIGD